MGHTFGMLRKYAWPSVACIRWLGGENLDCYCYVGVELFHSIGMALTTFPWESRMKPYVETTYPPKLFFARNLCRTMYPPVSVFWT